MINLSSPEIRVSKKYRKKTNQPTEASSQTFNLSRRQATKDIGNVYFPGNKAYGRHSIGESEILKCNPAAYLNTGKTTSIFCTLMPFSGCLFRSNSITKCCVISGIHK